ncbi:unnamed protein product [Owenia fusiformis]|uniref:G-protein coupled receptors family 1 profile domain-containing protein n=1 Tax=Owenia fusiformis TaxID=6347 RepID=A0A8S4NGZ6_OWEFU|nr:unnamed protein product [Owenia fusiformis]
MILCYFPKQYFRIFTWKTTPAIAFLPWLLSFLTYAPTLSTWVAYEYDPESMLCQYDLDFWPTNFYQFAILIVSVTSTFVSIIMTLFKIKQKKRSLSLIAPALHLMGGFMTVPKDDFMQNDKAQELRKELNDLVMNFKMLSCIFTASVIHWVPFIVGILSHHIVDYGRDFWTFANLLGHIQPGSDCLCYIIANKYFRTGYKNMLRGIFCCKKSDKVVYSEVANGDRRSETAMNTKS